MKPDAYAATEVTPDADFVIEDDDPGHTVLVFQTADADIRFVGEWSEVERLLDAASKLVRDTHRERDAREFEEKMK